MNDTVFDGKLFGEVWGRVISAADERQTPPKPRVQDAPEPKIKSVKSMATRFIAT